MVSLMWPWTVFGGTEGSVSVCMVISWHPSVYVKGSERGSKWLITRCDTYPMWKPIPLEKESFGPEHYILLWQWGEGIMMAGKRMCCCGWESQGHQQKGGGWEGCSGEHCVHLPWQFKSPSLLLMFFKFVAENPPELLCICFIPGYTGWPTFECFGWSSTGQQHDRCIYLRSR